MANPRWTCSLSKSGSPALCCFKVPGLFGAMFQHSISPVPAGTPGQKHITLWAGVLHKDTSSYVSERTRGDAYVTFGIPEAFDNNSFFLRGVSSYVAYLFTYLVANTVEQIHTSCLCVVRVAGTALSPLCLSLHLCLAPNPSLGD